MAAFPCSLFRSNPVLEPVKRTNNDTEEDAKMRNFFLLAAVAALTALPAIGQNAPTTKPTLGPSAALLASWNDIGRKLIAMAEDFPEDKYDFKPTPAQRSFAEQLLHVAGSNDLYTDVARGKKPVDDESPEHYKTKAAVVAYLKKSFADGASAIQRKGRWTDSTSSGSRLRCDRALWGTLRPTGCVLPRGGNGATRIAAAKVACDGKPLR